MVQIAAKSGVSGDLEDKSKVGGSPAINIIDESKPHEKICAIYTLVKFNNFKHE